MARYPDGWQQPQPRSPQQPALAAVPPTGARARSASLLPSFRPAVRLGLGRIDALYYHSSTSHHIHKHIR
jgi:hypothetical protein